jgi:ankyrin repeat protein
MNNDYFRTFLNTDVKGMINKFKNDARAELFRGGGEGLIYFTIVNNIEEVKKHINEYGININFVVYEIDNLHKEMVFGDKKQYVSIQGAINALNMALFFGYDEIARFLLENGADPNKELECDYTVYSRKHDINWWAGDNQGTSSLHFAFQNDNLEILKLILEKGANVKNFLNDIIYENEVIFKQPEYEITGYYPEEDEYPYLINNKKLYFLLNNIRKDDVDGLKLKETLLKQINYHKNFGFNNLLSLLKLRSDTNKEDKTRIAALTIMNEKMRAKQAEGRVTDFGGKKKRKSLKNKRKSKRRKSLKKKQRKTHK